MSGRSLLEPESRINPRCKTGLPRSGRRTDAFTLLELLVVVVIIGILAALALSNFIGARAKAQNAAVMSNMHGVQVASESYATDTSGIYANLPANLGPYFPGGSNSPSGSSGNFPANPISGAQDEVPFQETISTVLKKFRPKI